jgi:hypothetical protein
VLPTLDLPSPDCTTNRRRLTDAVAAQLDLVQGELADRQRRAAAAGPGSTAWAEATRDTVSLIEDAARLQAVADALAAADPHDGPCDDDCPCAAALATPAGSYRFPAGGLACDLAADGGDVRERVGVWQQVLTRVQSREPLPGTGVLLRFPLDAELAATLGRLAAAEYRCCSFGSYTLVVDAAGLRLEIRMPAEAAATLDAIVGPARS